MQHKSILIIEDDLLFLSELRRQLSAIGYRDDLVVTCTSLPGLSGIDPSRIEIILLSDTLKQTTLDNALKKVRELLNYRPVIVLTDNDDPDITTALIGRGAEDYLVKDELDEKLLKKSIYYALIFKRFASDYKRLFDENPGPMYIYDHVTYKFLGVNAAALAQYGYTREEFLSMSAKQIRPSETVEAFEQANQNKPEAYFDYGRWKHVNKKGGVFYVHIYAHTIEFEGTIARLVFAANIDKKVKAEMALREKAEEVEKQNEQLKKIAWINSHEIRGPVATILGLVKLFNKKGESDPMNAELIDKIEEATDKLDDIIKTIDFNARNDGWERSKLS